MTKATKSIDQQHDGATELESPCEADHRYRSQVAYQACQHLLQLLKTMADDNRKSDGDYIVVAGRRRWFDRMNPAKSTSTDAKQESLKTKTSSHIQ